MSAPMTKKQYIGDGLYVIDDGYHIVLETERMGIHERVFLDPDVLLDFLRFIEKSRNVRITVERRESDSVPL